MIPSDLFHDLVDGKIAFKVIKRDLNRPDPEISVSRASNGRLRLSLGKEHLTGNATSILARINALLMADSHLMPLSLACPEEPFLDDGKIVGFTIVPEAALGARKGLPAKMSCEMVILVGDLPTTGRSAILTVEVDRRERMYVVEMPDKGSVVETMRLSEHALPRDIHAKLAAAGYFDDSFLKLYGRDALRDAEQTRQDAEERWSGALHNAKDELFGRLG